MGDLQERLEAAFPATVDVQLAHAVQQGILLADGVVENEQWLRGPMARDVRGYLRRAGVFSRVHAACLAGDLPFASSLEPMPRGPFHWVEITSGEYKAHICRTESAGAFPDDTPTRQDERLTNQPSLFDNVVSLRKAADPVGTLFAWLSYGAPDRGKLGHLCWAMPAADGKSWLAHTNVLYRLAAADLKREPEQPTQRAVLNFRAEIADALERPSKSANDDESQK